jgi:short-subunit dehydrogenase
MRPLEDQWITITGASKGFGRALAMTFAQAGGNLILAARSCELLEQLRPRVEACGVECLTVAGDVTDDSVIASLTEIAIEKRLDILVNNAGVVDIQPLEDVSVERIRQVIELNLMAPIKLTKAVLPIFKARRSGTIINVNSAGGRKPVPHHTIYCASKYGLNGFFDTLKLEIKGLGIRVLNVCPGKMATDLFRAAGKDMDTAEFIPPEEVAGVVLNLIQMSPKCGPAEVLIDRMSSG